MVTKLWRGHIFDMLPVLICLQRMKLLFNHTVKEWAADCAKCKRYKFTEKG